MPIRWASSPTANSSPLPTVSGIEAGVDALLHMSRYELGVIPDELQRPLVDDPYGAAATTAYDYASICPQAISTSAPMRASSQRITRRSCRPSASTSSACPVIAISGTSPPLHCLIRPAFTIRPTEPLAS